MNVRVIIFIIMSVVLIPTVLLYIFLRTIKGVVTVNPKPINLNLKPINLNPNPINLNPIDTPIPIVITTTLAPIEGTIYEPPRFTEYKVPIITQPLPKIHMKLRVVNYNVFGRWALISGPEGQNERLSAIPKAIYMNSKMGPSVDIIIIEEAWCPSNTLGGFLCDGNKSRELLLNEFKKYGWKYSTPVVEGTALSIHASYMNGGTLIISKWPILATFAWVYHNASSGVDKFAAKGVVYARILKKEKGLNQVFNVFGTHLQAGQNLEQRNNRIKQLQQIKQFEGEIGIPQDGSEPIIYAGDMNVDFIKFPDDTLNMLKILDANIPYRVGDQKYTSDPSTNMLVGRDGYNIPADFTDKCQQDYYANLKAGKKGDCKDPHGDVKCQAYCTCCSHEALDYILWNKNKAYFQPTKYPTYEIIPLKSIDKLAYSLQQSSIQKLGNVVGDITDCITLQGCKKVDNKLSALQIISTNELSDHYPLVADFEFESNKKDYPLLDGCKSDSDCTWDMWNFNCKCTGDECSYKNKKYKSNTGWTTPWNPDIKADDGTNLSGMNSPLNKKCHFLPADLQCHCRPGDQF